jgi:DNA-binding MarR family transcriptional regulator
MIDTRRDAMDRLGEMLLAQYNLSRLVDRIEQAGYVERRAYEDDGRGQVLAITPAAKDLRHRMWGRLPGRNPSRLWQPSFRQRD